jgi:hypothetical protein
LGNFWGCEVQRRRSLQLRIPYVHRHPQVQVPKTTTSQRLDRHQDLHQRP